MEIVQIPKAKTFEQRTNAQAVELFEELLGRAKKGEILEATCLLVTKDGVSHVYTGADDLITLIGNLEAIKFRQLLRMHESDEE